MYLIVVEFAKWLNTSRGFAKSTIDGYVRSLDKFDSYIKDITFGERGVEFPHSIELEDIEEFAERERIRGKEIRTVNNYLA